MNFKKEEKEFFSKGNLVKILDFNVVSSDKQNHRLGINIQKIKEVVEYQSLKPLPKSYHPFAGIYNLRGTPIPVIYLKHFFEEQNSVNSLENDSLNSENSRIMICEFQKMYIGFIIAKTGKILTVPNSDLHPVPEALNFTGNRIFNGVLKVQDEFIHLLDVELILDTLQVDLGFDNTTEHTHRFKSLKVLLVEDSRLFQKKLQSFFEKQGMHVTIAADGLQGIEKLKDNNFDFDLIFSDIEMPHLNGIGMVRKIRSIPEAENIPIIFNTSISNPGLIEDIKREELGEYIVKFDEEEIHKVMNKVLKGPLKDVA